MQISRNQACGFTIVGSEKATHPIGIVYSRLWEALALEFEIASPTTPLHVAQECTTRRLKTEPRLELPPLVVPYKVPLGACTSPPQGELPSLPSKLNSVVRAPEGVILNTVPFAV